MLHAAAAGCTRILLGGPNMGRPRSRNLVLFAPIFFRSWTNQRLAALHQSQLTWSWAKVGGSCSLLGAILGGAGGCCPGNRLPL